GRLAPGASLSGAQHEMTAIASDLETKYPQADKGWTVLVQPLKDSMTEQARPTLLILLGGVICLLLIACANVAYLLLMRAAVRSPEMAIRIAIGAGRSRLIRQWLTESVVLGLAGGAVGIVLATWLVPTIVAFAPASLPRIREIAVDGRVLGFACML